MSSIAVLGTLDTKGVEHAFAADCIRGLGHDVLMVNVGGQGPAQVEADISVEQVAAEGGVDLSALRTRRDRGAMVEAMAQSAPVVMARLAREASRSEASA